MCREKQTEVSWCIMSGYVFGELYITMNCRNTEGISALYIDS